MLFRSPLVNGCPTEELVSTIAGLCMPGKPLNDDMVFFSMFTALAEVEAVVSASGAPPVSIPHKVSCMALFSEANTSLVVVGTSLDGGMEEKSRVVRSMMDLRCCLRV